MPLRQRIEEFWQEALRVSQASENSFVERLEAFIVAEIGRKADYSLEDTLPLCLYFGTPADRQEFLDAVREAKPGMITKAWP